MALTVRVMMDTVRAIPIAEDLLQRGTQRYLPIQRVDEDALTRAVITLASEYGRYGYRRITTLLRAAGWQVGKDRVQRIWRREGLKIPKKTKAKEKALAQCRLLRAAKTRAGQSRLEL